ncbi:MAG: hypothetical protein R3D81_11400 [Thalassovita sp.]
MSKATPATRALQQAKVAFETLEYDYAPDQNGWGFRRRMRLALTRPRF